MNAPTQEWLFAKGRPALLSAPLEGISDVFWRSLAFRFGCSAAYTEMLSAEALLRRIRQSWNKLEEVPKQFPVIVQIFGAEPASLADAAALCQDAGAAAVDINMGCPVPKIVSHGKGAALMREPALVRDILRAVRSRIAIALWIKIRLGWDDKSRNYLEIGRLAESEGVDAIALHGRTRTQKFTGLSDWEAVGSLKSQVGIPVFGSGDVDSGQKALEHFKKTDCDGILIGRGALGNPWIFAESEATLHGRAFSAASCEDRCAVMIEHVQWMVERFGLEKGLRDARKHIGWYVRGFPGNKQFREWFYQCTCVESAVEEIERFLKSKPPSN
ncbi:MAG TPA: tRNA dihydrouridine synthase DusB [bacterium]|nr:tRNA dihydrouridine synthase DusB [bacterium]